MEDWDADLSPCNFANHSFPAERSSFIFGQHCSHPFDSRHSALFYLPLTSRPLEPEDPFATPHVFGRPERGTAAPKVCDTLASDEFRANLWCGMSSDRETQIFSRCPPESCFPFRATGAKIQNNCNRSNIGFQAIQRNRG